METEVLQEVAGGSSMWSLLWASDMVTKVVLLGLILASVCSWRLGCSRYAILMNLSPFRRIIPRRCQRVNMHKFLISCG